MASAADINITRVGIINYQAIRGDTFAPLPVSFVIDGTNESFTGCTLRMQVRNIGDTVVKELTNLSGITVAGNQIQFSISATDTAALPVGTYKYDIQKTDGSGIVTTILKGTITFNIDETR